MNPPDLVNDNLPVGPRRAETAAPLDQPRSIRATAAALESSASLEKPVPEESAVERETTATTVPHPEGPSANPEPTASQPVPPPDVTLAEVDSVAAELEAFRPGTYAAVREGVRKQHIAHENAKIVEMIPSWADPVVRERESQELVRYAERLGVLPEQIQHFNMNGTARELAVWYRDWKRQTQPKPITMAKRGAAPAPTTRAYHAAAARAAKTGRRRDAMEAILQMGIISDTGS